MAGSAAGGATGGATGGGRWRGRLSARHGLGLALLVLLALPPLRTWWEGVMVRHMLGQIPLLILAGALLGPPPPAPGRRLPGLGIAAVLAAVFTLAFWMLPRWLDAAVTGAFADLAKIITLPLLAGAPLRWGWPQLGMLARGFFLAQFVAMLLVLGALYLGYPERLCTSYLVGAQQQAGRGLIAVAGALGVLAAARALFAPRPPGPHPSSPHPPAPHPPGRL